MQSLTRCPSHVYLVNHLKILSPGNYLTLIKEGLVQQVRIGKASVTRGSAGIIAGISSFDWGTGCAELKF